MAEKRHEALDIFFSKPMPKWGATEMLSEIDFDNVYYFMKPIEHQQNNWDDVPEYIKKTFDKVDVIETEVEYIDQGQEAVVSQKISRAAAGLMSATSNGIRFAVFNG